MSALRRRTLLGAATAAGLGAAAPLSAASAATRPAVARTATTLPGLRLDHLFGVATNRWHRTLDGGVAYGAWADGPMNPYRVGGDTFFQLAHSENYRIRIPGSDWGNRAGWRIDPDTSRSGFDSARSGVESDYSNRHWVFSVWSGTTTLIGLTHHEWYPRRRTVAGVPGFDQVAAPWVTGIGHVRRAQTGTTWSLTGQSLTPSSKRLVVVPEPTTVFDPHPGTSPSPWSVLPGNAPFYGFAHPSNLVRDPRAVNGTSFFYALTSCVTVEAGVVRRGVAVLRTASPGVTTGWQMWVGGRSWATVNHSSYQGNRGQRPALLFAGHDHGGELLGLNLRRHRRTGYWYLVGRDWQAGRPVQITRIRPDALANPGLIPAGPTHSAPVSWSGTQAPVYYSLFDASGASDASYQTVGSTALLVATMGDAATYTHQYISLP